MNNGVVEEQHAILPDTSMMYQLKPLFIRAKVDKKWVNKVFVDGGVMVNRMSCSLLKKIGKYDTYLRPHNVVLLHYEGKTSHIMGVILVELAVGNLTRPTIFMVISSKENYNLLLGQEWIHDISMVPSTIHQRISIWFSDGIFENIEADQRCYMDDVNHVGRKNFDKNLAKTLPCYSAQGFIIF